MALIHSARWAPRYYPYLGDVAPSQIDRLQDMSASVSLNREKIQEIGRDGTVSWRNKIPSNQLSLTQLEYGKIAFYQQLCNKPTSTNTLTLTDFKNAQGDLVGYKTDDDGTFLGSVWYPTHRTSSFSVNIGDPQSAIQRQFTLVGEDENILEGTNKYFNYQRFLSAAGASPETFTINSPSPVADPDNSGQYLFRVVRYRGTTTTTLTYTTGTPTGDQFKFVAPSTLTTATVTGDVIKVYYSAATFNTSNQAATFTNNNTDQGALSAENASIYLYVGSNNYVYRLQSVNIDVSFDRTDYYEIGNSNIVQRGIRTNTVNVTLGRILEAYTVEEVMRGVSSSFGRINTRNYRNDITLRVKLYGNANKNTFNIGYKLTGLTPSQLGHTVPTSDYAQRSASLSGEDCTISATESIIDA